MMVPIASGQNVVGDDHPKAAQSADLNQGASPSFAVEISIDQASLKTAFYRETGTFYVDTKIKNISATNREIIVWTQYGWSWMSDSPGISPGIEALANYPSSITLKPGQEYHRAIEAHADPHRIGPVTFRLGFAPQ